MEKKILLAVFAAFFLSLILMKLLIPVLRRLKFGQQIRQEGNPDHYKKQGTPTMGGIGFISAMLIVGIVFDFFYHEMIPTLILVAGFGAIGFIDDYLKVVKKQSEGFKAWQKLLCQLVLTAGYAIYCYKVIGTEVLIPFTGGRTWDMGWLYIPFVIVCVLGTDNGTNLTDGIDGLVSSVTAVICLFLMILSAGKHDGIAVLSASLLGALMGFLFYNSHPAKVFMGDTGALALGGYVAGAAITLKLGWFILIFGLIYLIEVGSVMIQVAYFKITHGKRIFKMSPIHHHYELSGYSETQIVAAFTCVTVLACVLAYMAM